MLNKLVFRLAAVAVAVAGSMLPAQAAPETVTAPDLTVDGSAFVLKLPDGRVLRGTAMKGAIVHMALGGGALASVRLDSIVPDPEDASILRHEFRIQNESGAWVPACIPNFYGETWGFPVALPEGHPGRQGTITLACAGDAVGKCARFGYKPWARGPHGEDLVAYHAACMHMVPADYCGNLSPHTKNGTTIDVYDRIGIQKPGTGKDAEFAFEAGWAPTGAVCVAHTRWPELQDRKQLGRDCPRLADEPASCTEAEAAKHGALLFNRSRLKPRIGE